MIHPGEKFSIYGLVKLENKLLIPKIQWWDKHRILVTDIPIRKGGPGRQKGVISSKQFQNSTGKIQVARPGNNPLWLMGLPSGPAAPPQELSFLFLKVSNVFLMEKFMNLFLAYRIWGVRQYYLSCPLCPIKLKLAVLLLI